MITLSSRVLLLCCMLTACSAHSPMILKTTTDFAANGGAAARAPHQRQVFVTRGTLPAGTYQVLGQVDVGTVWYGTADKALTVMADKARAIGADAVIDVATWHQPSGWSWAAPQAKGTAVVFTGKSRPDLSKIEGQYR